MGGHAPAPPADAKAVPIPQIVIELLTPTPSEIEPHNWHWSMYLIRWYVRMGTGQSLGSGVCGGPQHHWSNCQQEDAGSRHRGVMDISGGSQEMLRSVAEHTESAAMVQRVSNHSA